LQGRQGSGIFSGCRRAEAAKRCRENGSGVMLCVLALNPAWSGWLRFNPGVKHNLTVIAEAGPPGSHAPRIFKIPGSAAWLTPQFQISNLSF
jgi:hypothetical protein